MIIAQSFINEQHPKYKILKWCGIARSSFYYCPKTGARGRKPYAEIKNNIDQVVEKQVVISIIERLFENPFVDYGYYKTYIHLKKKEYLVISKHQVYAIMKDADLLRSRYHLSSKKDKRNCVQDLLPVTDTPFNYLEFDIKYVWVSGQRRNVQILTVLDVYSRWQMGHFIAFQIRKEDVIRLFDEIFSNFAVPSKITVRNDNGSQFIAQEVQDYFTNKKVIQEFTKPATPQQNSHIESYHSIIESAVCQRFEFQNLQDVRTTMNDFRRFYNFDRIHGGIGFQSPAEYLQTRGIVLNQKCSLINYSLFFN
jgi:transposase InsO family protein